jgi:hypothetical protein
LSNNDFSFDTILREVMTTQAIVVMDGGVIGGLFDDAAQRSSREDVLGKGDG